MAENIMERLNRIGAEKKIADFKVKQKQDYEFKKRYAYIRAWEFYNEAAKRDLDVHVSVGGLDSITLFMFLRSIGIHAPGISVSYLEDVSIQRVHKQLGIERLKSAVRYVDENGTEHRWKKPEILQEFGFPVLSKEIAGKIETLQHPTEKNKTVRHAIITGETGEFGGYRKNTRMKLSNKWLEKFGGYENENEGVNYGIPNFKVSSKCRYYLKEKPCDDWAKEHNSVPFLGLMASEGGRRAKSLMINGCNYFGKTTVRSAPFAIFNRQDILQLALELEVPVPEIYGTIERKDDGTLYTTKAQRTGCSMCGFGIQLEKRPHRFDLLKERNPKEWEYWMYRCCKDEDGTQYGWARVLDYIGIEY
nr:MAG TPA: phosphoadenosine-phosphosulfate reductase [Caudoviricetes sp.]